MLRGASILLGLFIAAPSMAQISGVYDMGTLTTTLAQDDITQAEERRANGHVDPRRSGATDASMICARKLPRFRRQFGAGHPKVVRLTSLCRRAGY